MTTMLDKCAVAGDITQAIDRRGAWTVALTVIGGTANTAVKIQSAPSASGVFTDFKTLISADDADADQYKGFVVDLHGADKFIKITGAVMATAVLGDCDHDIKDVTIKAGEVPSGADLEDNKAATIDVSAYTEPVEVSPSDGYDGMKKATVTLTNVSANPSFFGWGVPGATEEENVAHYYAVSETPAEGDTVHETGYDAIDINPDSAIISAVGTDETGAYIRVGSDETKYYRVSNFDFSWSE